MKEVCDPRDIAIKSFFLGPQAENGEWLKDKWHEIVSKWIAWRRSCFPDDGRAISPMDQNNPEFKAALATLDESVTKILRELEGETPKFSPRYIGHMVSEVSLPALLGHVCALLHNPNNTSREVSRVTSRLEEEAIDDLARMVGFGDSAEGHFTSGGTLANFEGLWRSMVLLDRRLSLKTGGHSLLQLGPWKFAKKYRETVGTDFMGPVVLVPNNKHFSWEKGVSLLGLGDESFWPIDLDSDGRLSLASLRLQLERAAKEDRPVMMVVSVAGTTELGEVDPVDEIQDILESISENRPWHHVDAAYGGYFASLLDGGELEEKLSERTARSLRAMGRADSITLDPHKLGYVPYACGAFIARDSEHYATRHFRAAYLDAKNESRWASTLEGSRSGSGATAVWLSHRTLGLGPNGYGRVLSKGLEGRKQLMTELKKHQPQVLVVEPSDLNIVCFTVAPQGGRLKEANACAQKLFQWFSQSPHFAASRTQLSRSNYEPLIQRVAQTRNLHLDDDHLFLLRLVLMNPFIVSKETNTHFIQEFVKEVDEALQSSEGVS